MKQTATRTVLPEKPAKDFNEWANHIHGHFRNSAMNEEMNEAKQKPISTSKFYRP